MADETKEIQARQILDMICEFFDDNHYGYDKDEKTSRILYALQGEDLDMYFSFSVNADAMLVTLFSQLPFEADEDRRADLATAVNEVNTSLQLGSFDYNIHTGRIFFRMTNSYSGTPVNKDVISDMFYMGHQIVDAYDENFMMVAKGMTSIDQFLESMKGGN